MFVVVVVIIIHYSQDTVHRYSIHKVPALVNTYVI